MDVPGIPDGPGTLPGIGALASLEAAGRARGDRAAEALRHGKEGEAGLAFESFFAQIFVREMRRALPQGFFGGTGSDVYTSWLDQHLGDALASTDALGIAGMVRTALGRERGATAGTPDAAPDARVESEPR